MEIPQWEDKTPKTNKVKDGRLVRPWEQAIKEHPEIGKLADAVRKILGRPLWESKPSQFLAPKEDKDAGPE